MRALRCGKLVLSALDATLAIYERGAALDEIPGLRAIAATTAEVKLRAERARDAIGDGDVVATIARVGAGAQPTTELASFAVRLAGHGDVLLERLRTGNPGVIARIEDGAVLLDLRAVADEDVGRLTGAVRRALDA